MNITECCVHFGTFENFKNNCITHCDTKNQFETQLKNLKSSIVKKLKTVYTHVYDIYDSRYLFLNCKSKNYSIFIFVGENFTEYQNEMKKNFFIDYYCADYTINVEEKLLPECAALYKQYHDNIKSENSLVNVIVFDFDDTLVRDKHKKTDSETPEIFYECIWCDLLKYRDYFNFIVLWTHGTEDYIQQQLSVIYKTTEFRFSLVIARKRSTDIVENKGLGAVLKKLNADFGVGKINFACLVDDKLSNFKLDYDLFVHVGTVSENYYRKKLKQIEKRLSKFNRNKFTNADRYIIPDRNFLS